MNNSKVLAIIPARGGSKRLPNKNVLPLKGLPLITHTINAALQSTYIDKIVVTSDSIEILNIAKSSNVEALQRPSILANDTASSIDVVLHVLENFPDFDTIVLLQPTSPLRLGKHIDEAFREFFDKNASAVISVCQMEHSPLWCNTLPQNHSMTNFINKEVLNKRSQDLEKYYRLNGAIYIINKQNFIQEKTFLIQKNIYAYIMEQQDSIDIDTKLDFMICETILNSSTN